MNTLNIVFMLAGAAMVLTLIPALLLLRDRMIASSVLASALLLAAANIFHALIISPAQTSHILLEPLQFALPPLFAAYVQALFDASWRPTPRHLVHFLPVVATAALAVGLTGFNLPNQTSALISLAMWSLLLIQAVCYVSQALRRIGAYRAALKREKSNLTGIDPVWLVRYSIALHGLYLGYLIVPAIVIHTNNLEIARYLISLIMCLAVGYLALHQILAARPPAISLTPANLQAVTDKPTFDPQLPEALRVAMAERRLYQNPDLDLSLLATVVGWPRNEVSAAINGHFGCNFHDFVNGYRVAEAKRLMTNPANSGLTLLALGLQAGFNSKPTFNAVFKKIAGCSPSAWLKLAKQV